MDTAQYLDEPPVWDFLADLPAPPQPVTIGPDRVLFSVDSPYETAQEQSDWFDSLPISETDRSKIGRVNALQLMRLSSPDA